MSKEYSQTVTEQQQTFTREAYSAIKPTPVKQNVPI